MRAEINGDITSLTTIADVLTYGLFSPKSAETLP